ncbi:carboxypeptidase regulatory-like domain-containing protein [Streptacidiphilus albus]|uniref:carboxypeptidase regulatory-like domain-containing protein n=1 Tax=Streptacidiphilus albus TaxID=105425 RepID=UPI0007C7A40D|nr:carboxypeptidase regulatory-like domain-containing protein [Streptacidiphilus albus]
MAATEQGGASAVSGEPRPRWTETAKALASSLWFPALFFFGFLFCYLLAFHDPTPHDIRVAAPAPAAAGLQQGLDRALPGWYRIVPVPGGTAGLRQAVLDRHASGAYLPDPVRPTLYTAKAGGFEIVAELQAAFTPIAEAAPGVRLTQVELAPTAPHDGMGTSLFYLCLGMTIPSYIMVMMMLRATGLSRKKKVAAFVASGAVMAVVGFYIALAMDCIVDRPLCILFAFLLTQAVALTSYGLVPFARQFFPGVAIVVFVLLSMPASGGAIPIQMVPPFFRALHPYLPLGNLVDAMRGEMYFRGTGLFRPLLALSVWVASGIVLICLGYFWEQHRIATARSAGDRELTPGQLESMVQDPALEMPEPMPVTAHLHYIGASQPMLSGRIQDAHSQPLRGVLVTVTSTDNKRRLTRARTDEHGEYRVTGLPEGYVNVIAGGRRMVPSIEQVLVRSGHLTHQDFVLRPHHPEDPHHPEEESGPPAPAG